MAGRNGANRHLALLPDLWYGQDRSKPQQVQILQAAVRKTFEDPEYSKEQKKLTGEDSTPLMPEAFEKVVRELPREPETIDLFNKLSGADPFPPQ